MAITATQTIHRSRGRLNSLEIAFTTNGTGDVAVSTVGSVFGRIVAVKYEPGDVDTGADLTLSDVDSGAALITLTNAGTTARSFRPTAVVTTSAGVAITPDATAPNVNRDIYVAGKVKLLVAQGGDTKTGKLTLVLDEE